MKPHCRAQGALVRAEATPAGPAFCPPRPCMDLGPATTQRSPRTGARREAARIGAGRASRHGAPCAAGALPAARPDGPPARPGTGHRKFRGMPAAPCGRRSRHGGDACPAPVATGTSLGAGGCGHLRARRAGGEPAGLPARGPCPRMAARGARAAGAAVSPRTRRVPRSRRRRPRSRRARCRTPSPRQPRASGRRCPRPGSGSTAPYSSPA
mgnify:FL=1